MSPGARPRAILIATLISVIALAWAGRAAPTVWAATPAVKIVSATTYDVRPNEHRVAVTVAITATSTLRDTTTRRFYSDRAYIAVLPSATNLDLVASKGKPSVSVSSRSATNLVLLLRFGSQLGAGKSIGLTLTFDIVDPGGAPDRTLRISPSLVRFSAWALGTDGVPGSTVRVVLPPGYAASVGRGPLSGPVTEADGNVTYSSDELATPGTFVADVTADRPGVLLEGRRSVAVSGRMVILSVLSWPDDSDWRSQVTDVLQRGLPALGEAIGLDWPLGDVLAVRETIGPAAGGGTGAGTEGSGAFDPANGRLDIPYTADPTAILHGAAHAWFNAALVGDRWAAEGFADLYAARAGRAIGIAVRTPEMTTAARKHAQPLNAWVAGEAQDDYGYAASLQLARNIAGRAGDDALAAVWLEAAAGIGAYQPVGAPGDTSPASAEKGMGPVDWRSLLDLLEKHTNRSFDALWRTWVVRPGDASLLDARGRARAEYDETVALAGPWVLPRSVRDAMRAWQFETATAELSDLRTILEQRENIARGTAAAGLQAPATLRLAFEGATSIRGAAAEAVTEQAVIDSFNDAVALQPSDPDLVTAIGLIGTDPETDVLAARRAFAAGDLDGTVAHAQQARTTWLNAADIGGQRIVSGATIAFGLTVLMWLLVSRLRSRRPRQFRHAQRVQK